MADDPDWLQRNKIAGRPGRPQTPHTSGRRAVASTRRGCRSAGRVSPSPGVRVFVASGGWPPDAGGPATHVADVVPWLRARHHDVRVLAYSSGDTHRADGVTRVALRAPLALRAWRYARAYRQDAGWADVIYAASLGLPRRPAVARPVVLRVPGDRAWERAINRGLVPPTEDIDRFQRCRHRWFVEYPEGRPRA